MVNVRHILIGLPLEGEGMGPLQPQRGSVLALDHL